MDSTSLKLKFKERKLYFAENNAIRIHRAISWLESAEDVIENDDLAFISLWVSFTSCYSVRCPRDKELSEKQKYRVFLNNLVKLDKEKKVYSFLLDRFSVPPWLINYNQYISLLFWYFQRGEINRRIEESVKFLSDKKVVELLELLFDNIYLLRNRIVNGGAIYKDEEFNSQLIAANEILTMLIPLIIEIMMENGDEYWGEIDYYLVWGLI